MQKMFYAQLLNKPRQTVNKKCQRSNYDILLGCFKIKQ